MKVFDNFGRLATATFSRFFLPMCFAVAASVSIASTINNEYGRAVSSDLNSILYLGMLLTLSFTLFAETHNLSVTQKIAGHVCCVAAVALYFYALHYFPPAVVSLRFTLISVALHFLVSFSPFIGKESTNGMWQYNKTLFLRFLLAALYSSFIFGGISLALLAINGLLKLEIPEDIYEYLFIFVEGIFNTWFFLAGVPKNIPLLEEETGYPKGLKVFTVYILLPLVCIYVVILYMYMLKVLLSSETLEYAGILIFLIAVFGILSFLLLYPLRFSSNHHWVKYYSTIFYILLLPLVFMSLAYELSHIAEYGVREDHYVWLLLFCWLIFIAVYSILTKGRNIKIIPLSLCLVCLLFSFGPWGVFSVSKNSQLRQLTLLLKKNNFLVKGVVDTSHEHRLKLEDAERVTDLVTYLEGGYGYKSLQPLFAADLDKFLPVKNPDSSNYQVLFAMLHMKNNENYRGNAEEESVMEVPVSPEERHFGTFSSSVVDVSGYSYSIHFDQDAFSEENNKKTFYKTGSGRLVLFYNSSKKRVEINCKSKETLIIPLNKLFGLFGDKDEVQPDDALSVTGENSDMKAKIVFSSLSLYKQDDAYTFGGCNTYLLIKMK